MPPTRPDRHRPTPKAQPPRPPNAWILYRSDKLREIAESQPTGPRRPQAEISKIISQMWSAEGPETKGMYEARAEEKKAEHAALYPDYKFAPMKKEDKALLRRAQRQEKEELRAAERNRAKRRKGKGRDDDPRPFVAAPYPVRQSWYPPSTYGPREPGWSAPVDPQGHADDAFCADAYQADPDAPNGDGDGDEWTGEEGEWGAEEAWAGRARRGAVWDEEQLADADAEYQVGLLLLPCPAHPPQEPQPDQPPSLTITLPATLGPSDQPYTFNLDFDMPMATFAGDPDANVALSLDTMNLSDHPNPNGLLADITVPGLNDLLEAPLPDIEVEFPQFVGNTSDDHPQFDVLSDENQEWWAALMDVALTGDDRTSYNDPGPSQSVHEPAVTLTRPLRPTPVHTQSLPTFHGLPSPDGEGPRPSGSRSRATSSAAYQMPGAFPTETREPSRDDSQYYYPTYSQPPPEEPYVHPSPFVQIVSSRSAGQRAPWRPPQRPRARTMAFPAPNGPGGFPTPSGARGFPSPSGAAPLPSPSGAVPIHQPRGFPATPQTTVASPHPPRPPPPFFNPRRVKDEDKGKDKDPEAFDFSGWGSQYAAQPPTPAEDAVRRGVGVSHW
ncbi:hypothetical protein CTheo_3711 [Ceratobasidium theobromae]|uniref:HMG box domain-containing protein n=1 Tax=Ceratobasidium theobromae TaxID=1582974 RepID=A0A5N5QMV4_9AGAM|nr:hypothetical protein CTheo_3711 [Ceratobasidium theobromae]